MLKRLWIHMLARIAEKREAEAEAAAQDKIVIAEKARTR